MAWLAALSLLGVLWFAAAPFSDISASAGMTYVHRNSATSHKHLPETMGGGVAMFDYDNDGRLDIFFVNGARLEDPMPKGVMPDKSDARYWNRLYRQTADGRFTDVTLAARLNGLPQNRYGMGVAAGDFDNDGFVDLYVTGLGGNTLYRNNGNGTFEDVTSRSRAGGSGWSTSAGFFDYNNDGRLDLFVCRYVEWSFEMDRFCGVRRPGGRSYCHPDNYTGMTNLLYRNDGGGAFTDVSAKAGIANSEGKSLGVAFADYDADGWTDIYVANDSVQSFLYRNRRDGTFEDVSLAAGTGFNEDGKTFAGMGTDFSDYDNDGRPDIVVTDLSNERYVLFRNSGDGTFADLTGASGLGRASLPYSGWSTRFFDYDKDGWKDLFVAQGHVMDNIESTSPNLKYLQPPLLLRNQAGKFSKVDVPALGTEWAGRGAAFGDIDNDGDIDIVVTNIGQRAYLLRNEAGPANRSITIALTGTRSNRDGIGARIRIAGASGLAQSYTVNTAAGYLSAVDKRVIVGIGKDEIAKSIEVTWPSGASQRIENVRGGRTLRLTEPSNY